jgi:hypothetical protein
LLARHAGVHSDVEAKRWPTCGRLIEVCFCGRRRLITRESRSEFAVAGNRV